jgi:caffeoyl-CoA O-methyltransferase
MELFDPDNNLKQYIESHCFPNDPVLTELFRYTYLNAVNPRMVAGPVQGKFLEMVSKMIRPEKILEIGTFTGYSAICLARGLSDTGKLTTIEVNDELREAALVFFEKAGLKEKIELINGNALDIIPDLPDMFNLIYIDGDKEHYPDYYRLAYEKLLPGGFMLADNVLWDGKVISESRNPDKATRGILEFNTLVQDDVRVENLLMPFRDGLMLVRKKF